MHPAREEVVKDDEGTFRFVELFAGIGGFRLGPENPGAKAESSYIRRLLRVVNQPVGQKLKALGDRR